MRRSRRPGVLRWAWVGWGAIPWLVGCETVLPPLRGEIVVGEDAYLLVAGGDPARADLYVFAPASETTIQVTYTAVAELAPRLSPDGALVALLRAGTLGDSIPGTAWVLNLRTGGERELALPRGAGLPREVGWARDGQALFVRAASATYRFGPPFGRERPAIVPPSSLPVADSSFAVLLGDPVFAVVTSCEAGASLCVTADTGAPQLLVRDAREAVRWGSDSVGYLVDGLLEVRPLGPGRVHRVEWPNAPDSPRSPTYFPGR